LKRQLKQKQVELASCNYNQTSTQTKLVETYPKVGVQTTGS